MNTIIDTPALARPNTDRTLRDQQESTHTGQEPLRIAHLLGGREGGGITRAIASLLQTFNSERVESSVVILRNQKAPGDEMLRPFAPVYLRKIQGRLGTARYVAQLCREQQIDILHTHSISSNFYGRMAGLMARNTSVVTTVHARTSDELRGAFRIPLIGRTISRADLVMHRLSSQLIAVSGWLRNDLIRRGVPADKLTAVPHGVTGPAEEEMAIGNNTLRKKSGIRADTFIVGIVGRLTPVKNHNLLIDAVARLRQTYPNVVLVIVGDGPLRTELEQQAAARLPEGSVCFVGWVDDVMPYVRMMDVLVACSKSEGFGYTVLEAMSCGRPVIASHVAALPEIVREGETGLLVPPDDPNALASAIEWLCKKPDLRIAMGSAAQQDVQQRFSIQREANQTWSIYQQVRKRAGS